jgi:replicative DNA helicase
MEIRLPTNTEAERSILGAILADNDVLYDVAGELIRDHFSLDSHKKIYSSMIALREDDVHIDEISLGNELAKRKELQAIGGYGLLAELSEGAITKKRNVPEYIRILKEKAALRQVIVAANNLMTQALEQKETADKIIATFDVALQEIMADVGSGKAAPRKIGDYRVEVFADIKRLKEHTGTLAGLTYGVNCVDYVTTGMRRKETVVIGGRPGSGKSSFAWGCALANAREDHGVYYGSAEMPGESLYARGLSCLGKVNTFRIRDPKQLEEADDFRLTRAADELGELPLWVDEIAGLHISQVLNRARLLKRKHNIELFIFDFAQLMLADGKDRYERVSNVAEAIARFSRTDDCASMLLSQLGREDKKTRKEIPPTMDDLKGSGSLEENADMVGLLWRRTGEHESEDQFIVAKQRHGPRGSEKVYFNKDFLVYKDRE